MGRKKSTKPAKWPEAEYGLDNTYCFEERIHYITVMLQRRYGDTIRSTPLRYELHMAEKEFQKFIAKTQLFRLAVRMGTYKVEDVAQIVAAYL